MKRGLLGMALVAGACGVLGGCGSSSTTSADYAGTRENAGGSSGSIPGDPSTAGGGTSSGSSTSGAPDGTTTGTPGDPIKQGNLTAGVWDDELNFDFFKKYYESQATGRIFTFAEHDGVHARIAQSLGAKTQLDVGIVLDTTGSMGDEIRYLQNEMAGIAGALAQKFPGVTPRFGLVVYRDTSDIYVTKSFDFTTDLAAFQTNLGAQGAGGGGDIPEAVPEGLAAGAALSWRDSDPSVAKMMFFVADAPQHPGQEGNVKTAIQAAVTKGVKIFPVAASGTDPGAERTMREAAHFSGGRYLFLTDDSGIGNAHAEPHIPCYNVTRLDKAMVRMVESEMNGHRIEPAAADVIRTVGDPKDGKCSLKDSSQVVLY